MLFTQLLRAPDRTDSSRFDSADTLDRAPIGQLACIRAFRPGLGDSARHLQAYGLLPGRTVLVLSHAPLTIIQIEQTELALERSVAKHILVDVP
jgi:Fe2+ transport system protein FeoA